MNKKISSLVFSVLTILFLVNCQAQPQPKKNNSKKNMETSHSNYETATFAGGCFWCLEAAYDQLKGVTNVQSGYAGGHVENPSYKQVCGGDTGHAEVVQITYDPKVISYNDLLNVFWTLHDPTQLNRQGNDVGPQYRSEIFYHNEEQKKQAEASLKKEEESGHYDKAIVTKISPLNDNFYPAEDYHTDYYELNKTQPYCSAVIAPKMEKFYKKFHDKLKEEYQ